MFVRTKIIDGKKRRYLVESYRNAQGKPRQRHICYVDLWPKKDIETLVWMIERYREHLAEAENPAHTKAFKRVALDKADKLDVKIQKFKRSMDDKLEWKRARADKRSIDQTTGVRHAQNAREETAPFSEFIVAAGKLGWWLKQMEANSASAEDYYANLREETLFIIESSTRLIAERHGTVTRLLKSFRRSA
jgi:hypothetical protein